MIALWLRNSEIDFSEVEDLRARLKKPRLKVERAQAIMTGPMFYSAMDMTRADIVVFDMAVQLQDHYVELCHEHGWKILIRNAATGKFYLWKKIVEI
jgi:hypothetical protein